MFKFCKKYVYSATNTEHPGRDLLPPSDIINYPTIPASVLDQISLDGSHYDLYGKFGIAYEDSYIDRPYGEAQRDFEEWLVMHPDVRQEINDKIHANWKRLCTDEEVEDIP